ncbi:hypothetical protein OESDEN_24295 [Oesophagostomum dentatum]|uniref:Conserved Oligomeric Golgi complex subunit 6 C-terminal domain-containing protein n=1 Tax=Oesophagostomum dentatum TaxID=61180 RepID=A0A0B1RWS6_OESDE|nr:hypothetical protein OESDEN_24295 [Oesophagostomum dentatum]
MIKALMEGNEDVLVSEEASTILANTGLINLYQKASAHDRNQGPLSAIPGMDAATINSILVQFDVYLAQPDKYQLDQVAKISSARTRYITLISFSNMTLIFWHILYVHSDAVLRISCHFLYQTIIEIEIVKVLLYD